LVSLPIGGGTMQKQRRFSHYSLDSFFYIYFDFLLFTLGKGQTHLSGGAEEDYGR
jgi:hypothetical protein